MFQPSLRTLCALAMLGMVATACSERQNTARADSELSHDLALAGRTDTPPALNDTVVSASAAQPNPDAQHTPNPDRKSHERAPLPEPAQVASAPQQAVTPVLAAAQPPVAVSAPPASAPAPVPVAKEFDAGTTVVLASGTRVCTSTNRVGDKITARVSNAVTGSGGAMIAAGTPVVLEVTQMRPADPAETSGILLRATSVYIDGVSYPVSGDIANNTPLEKVELPSTGVSDAGKVAGGAVVGGILGQLLGHNTKGTVIGAAAGAAAGAAVAHVQKSYQACLPEGASLRLTLGNPLTLN